MTATRRSIIVCDWVPPEFGAVGQYMEARAREEAARGEVVVLIGLGQASSVETHEIGAGRLKIVRLEARKFDKASGLLARASWTLRALFRLSYALAREQAGEKCRILVTGSPPFLAYILIVMNRLSFRRALTYRITDFFPEVVFAAGHLRAIQPVEGIFHFIRRRATRLEALGFDQEKRLLASGVPADRITVVRDASPISDPHGGRHRDRPFSADKVTLLYSGNLGVAHDIDTFCAAYHRHCTSGSGRVRLWVNGVGARLPALREYVSEHNLPVHFSDPVALEDLPGVLRAADAHLVLLSDAFWGYVLPSKIYACLEHGQPVFYVGPQESDVHLLASARQDNYFHAVCGDVDRCAAALELLADKVLSRVDR